MGKIRPLLLILLPALLAGLLANRARAGANPCTGAGHTGQTILCSGTCPSPGVCKAYARSVGNETAVFCGCQKGQNGWACCYLLQYTSGDHKDEFFVLGTCIQCPPPVLPRCKLGGSGTLADPFVAECAQSQS